MGAVPLSEPCAGGVTIVYESVSPSGSVAVSTIGTAVSSEVGIDCGCATGGRLVYSSNANTPPGVPAYNVRRGLSNTR